MGLAFTGSGFGLLVFDLGDFTGDGLGRGADLTGAGFGRAADVGFVALLIGADFVPLGFGFGFGWGRALTGGGGGGNDFTGAGCWLVDCLIPLVAGDACCTEDGDALCGAIDLVPIIVKG